jgi:hypothetical protein
MQQDHSNPAAANSPTGRSLRVVLLGASGMFGQRLAALLASIDGVQLVLAGRRQPELEALARRLGGAIAIETLRIDLDHGDAERILIGARPEVLIDTCGPFQQRDYALARLAIAERFHYIDLADAADHVADIGVLDAEARAAGVLITSGASTVPALSAAVIDAHRASFRQLLHVDIGITPGNRAERGAATVRSVLSTVGKPHIQFIDGAPAARAGWSSLRRHRYAKPVGARWLAYCAVPDPLLLPARYPGLRSLQMRAGLELHRMHFGTWLGGLLVRLRLLRSLTPYADWARRLSERWIDAGSDCGAMHVQMRGIGRNGAPLSIEWQLIAEHGDGPYVPTAAAASLVRLLITGLLQVRGAMPCIGLVPLPEFAHTLAQRSIRFATGPAA